MVKTKANGGLQELREGDENQGLLERGTAAEIDERGRQGQREEVDKELLGSVAITSRRL